jgi:hypothetical protein
LCLALLCAAGVPDLFAAMHIYSTDCGQPLTIAVTSGLLTPQQQLVNERIALFAQMSTRALSQDADGLTHPISAKDKYPFCRRQAYSFDGTEL